jgi:tryptophan-rich sensory protein
MATGPEITPPSLFERIWPVAFIAISLLAVITWTGIIGYGAFRLGGLAF